MSLRWVVLVVLVLYSTSVAAARIQWRERASKRLEHDRARDGLDIGVNVGASVGVPIPAVAVSVQGRNNGAAVNCQLPYNVGAVDGVNADATFFAALAQCGPLTEVLGGLPVPVNNQFIPALGRRVGGAGEWTTIEFDEALPAIAANDQLRVQIPAVAIVTSRFTPVHANPNEVWLPCAVVVVGSPAASYKNELVATCAAAVMVRAGIVANNPAYVFETSDADPNPVVVANAAIGADLQLAIRRPIVISVYENVAGVPAAVPYSFWARRPANNGALNFGAALLQTVNAYGTLHANLVGDGAGLNCVMDQQLLNGAPAAVAWNAAMDLTLTTVHRIEQWRGGRDAYVADLFATVGAVSRVAIANSREVFYVAGSGDIIANRANVITHLATASGGAAGVMTPGGLVVTLANDHAYNGVSRALKRNLENENNAETYGHFGYGFFDVTVSIPHKTVGIAPMTKHIGVIAAFGNLQGIDVDRHTEARAILALRTLIVGIETAARNTHGLATARVTDVSSRWILDYVPDDSAVFNCAWMLQWTAFTAEWGYFRESPYTDDIRVLAQKNRAGARVKMGNSVLARKIEWNPPTIHFIYSDPKAFKRRKAARCGCSAATQLTQSKIGDAANSLCKANVVTCTRAGLIWQNPSAAEEQVWDNGGKHDVALN